MNYLMNGWYWWVYDKHWFGGNSRLLLPCSQGKLSYHLSLVPYSELQTGILLVEVVKQVILLVFVDTRQSIVDQAKNQKDARSSNCCNKIFATTAETGDPIAVP